VNQRSEHQQPPAPAPISRRKRLVFCGVLIFLGLFAGLVSMEIIVRVLGLKPQALRGKRYLTKQFDPSVIYHCYSSNPNGEFRSLPDMSWGEWQLVNMLSRPPSGIPLSQIRQTPWCIEDRKSDQCLRDRHYDLVPPPGKLRVAVVGDSFARGEGVPVERSLPKQIEALLGADQYEIMNVGFSGIDTAEEVTRAQDTVRLTKAQRVLLVFIPNDICLTPELLQRQESINDLILIQDYYLAKLDGKRWYRRSPLVVQLVGASFEMRRITQETIKYYLDSYDPARNPEGLRLLAADFRTLGSIPDCRVAVVLYPLMFGLEGDYPFALIHSRVAGMVRGAGLPVLDLAPAFKGQKSSALQVHPSDHHPNSRAHAIAAQAICKWLREEVPGFLAVPVGDRLKPDNADANNKLGSIPAKQGQMDEAIRQVPEAICLEPDDVRAQAHNKLGIALASKGQTDEAIGQFQEAVRLKPDYADAHNNLGGAFGRKRQTDEAIHQFQEAIRVKPDYAFAHYNLGNALLMKGQMDEAIRQFQEAIRLKPDHAEARYNLGTALASKGQTEEAITQYQEAIRLDPGHADAQYNLGLALASRDQTEEAMPRFEAALKVKPDYPEAHNHLGLALIRKGQIDEAIQQFQEALKLRPDYADARKNLDVVLAAKAHSSTPPGASSNR
jgi:tetratricopeptide (TPR) repeat protein